MSKKHEAVLDKLLSKEVSNRLKTRQYDSCLLKDIIYDYFIL